MTADFATVEHLAAQLCHMAGGNWSRPKTHRNLWRKRVLILLALAAGDTAEADRLASA